jgi:hypothetical protein
MQQIETEEGEKSDDRSDNSNHEVDRTKSNDNIVDKNKS